MSDENAGVKSGDTAGTLVKALEQSYKSALPSHITMEHFSRALLTEFRRNPALMECEKATVSAGVLLFAQLGLMIGVNGAGWLIPFRNKRGTKDAVAVIGYQGLVDLCYRSDRVESIFADVICENDEFVFEQGINQKLSHIPNLRGARGNPYAVYAVGNIKGSSRPVYVVLNTEEIMAVKNSSRGAERPESPWNGAFETEMWKKTALRRLTKLLPKSVELAAALDFENRQAEELKEVPTRVVPERAQISISQLQPGSTADHTAVDQPLGDKPKRGRPAKAQPPEPTPEELALAESQRQKQKDALAENQKLGDELEAAVTPELPADYCEDYATLFSWQFGERKQPAMMQRAINRARDNEHCQMIKTWPDINPESAEQCSTILMLFDKFRATAQGK